MTLQEISIRSGETNPAETNGLTIAGDGEDTLTGVDEVEGESEGDTATMDV